MPKQKKDDFVLRDTPETTVSPVTKKVIELPVSPVERRAIRYRLGRIMNSSDESDAELRCAIEAQFVDVMEWSNFTRVWDVSEIDPLVVVRLEGY